MEAPKRDGEMNESAEALKRDEERGDCPEATSEPTFEPQIHEGRASLSLSGNRSVAFGSGVGAGGKNAVRCSAGQLSSWLATRFTNRRFSVA